MTDGRARTGGFFGWNALSVALHALLFALIVLLTPVRQLILPKQKTPAPRQTSRETIRNIDEKLSEVRSREIQREVTTLQTVLNDMDVVRDQLRQDFDDQVRDRADTAKDELRKQVEEIRAAQRKVLDHMDRIEKKVDRLDQLEKGDLSKTSEELEKFNADFYFQEMLPLSGEQLDADAALEKTALAAEFSGFEKVAKVARELRDAQLAATRVQEEENKRLGEEVEKFVPFRAAERNEAEAKKKAESERKEEASRREKAAKENEEAKSAEKRRDEAKSAEDDANARRAKAEEEKRKAQGEKNDADNRKRQAESRKRDAENRARNAENEQRNAENRANQEERNENAARERAKTAENERAAAQKRAEEERERERGANDRAAKASADEQNARGRDDKKAADAARSERDKAAREAADAKNRAAQADRQANDAKNRADRAEREANDAKNRKEQARRDATAATQRKDKERATAAEEGEKAKQADADFRAADSRVAAAQRESDAAQRQANEARGRRERAENDRRNAQNRANENARQADNAAARAKEQDKLAGEEKKKADEIRERARSFDPATHRSHVERQRKAQKDVLDAVARLEAAIEEDVAVVRLHAPEEVPGGELARRDVSALSISEAYEYARELEIAVTESYREVVAAATAIAEEIPLEEAERITDVATPSRPEIDAKLLDGRAQTSEELAAQKEARFNAMRETQAMSETSVGLLDAAFVTAGFSQTGEFREGEGRSRQLQWLKPGDLSAHSRGELQTDRFHALGGLDMQLQGDAKPAGAKRPASPDTPMGGLAQSGVDKPFRQPKPSSGRGAGEYSGEPQFRPEAGTGIDLRPGNVLSLGGSSASAAGNWMYLESWWIIGPFPNPDRANITRKFPPESIIDLDATYEGKYGTMKWEFVQARHAYPASNAHRHRAEVLPPKWDDFAIWYAWTLLTVDRECDAYLAVGSDDRSDVWINGVKAFWSKNGRKVWKIAEESEKDGSGAGGIRKIHLRKGANAVLVRLENGPGPTSFSVCVSPILAPGDRPPPL